MSEEIREPSNRNHPGRFGTVDGQNPAPPRMMNYPITYRVFTIPGGARFCPSTVLLVWVPTTKTPS